MSEIYIPGINSRFDTDKLVENLMRIERIPLDRVERNVESLQNQKTYWQDLGRRMNSLRESARMLFSYQNPFNDRIVASQEDGIIGGNASREAVEQERTFTIKQIAQADRFLSQPLEESYRVESGTYAFQVGTEEISFAFRGGSLREFAETLTRRGREKIQASVITVERGSRSLLIESLVTGAANRLIPSEDAEQLALAIGMMARVNDSRRDVLFPNESLGEGITLEDEALRIKAGGSIALAIEPGMESTGSILFSFEAATYPFGVEDLPQSQKPSGPAIPSSGSTTYGGITVENDESVVTIPEWIPPPPPERIDDMGVLTLAFTDGTRAALPPIADSNGFAEYQYNLSDFAGNRTLSSIEIHNRNTYRDIAIQNIRAFDPDAIGGLKPLNAVSTAQDGILTMDGITIIRPTNTIDDLIPGVTLLVRNPSDRPVRLNIQPDRPGVKEAIINLVGNYNRLMADINILTRLDERLIQELTYLTRDEEAEYRERLGAFSTDTTLNQYRNSMQRITSSPYLTTAEQDLTLLAQIGIGTDVRRAGASTGIDSSRLRGYLEIDERILDNALETQFLAIRQLFGNDTDGDLIVDSGIAYSLDTITRPYVETGGLLSMKTSSLDSRIEQDGRRIETLERQLAAKEASMRNQYAQMEGAYNRLEQLSTSLDQFNRQQIYNNNNSR